MATGNGNEETPGHSQDSTSTAGQGNNITINQNHPLFLAFANVSSLTVISFQLKGSQNYILWNKSMKISLLGCNKLGLVYGSCQKGVVSSGAMGAIGKSKCNCSILAYKFCS